MTVRFRSLTALCAVAASVVLSTAGCHVHIVAENTNPKPNFFYYPAGVAIDPDGQLLYVSNGNADLRYAGGTLMTVDLQRFHCALDAFRQKVGEAVVPDPVACAPYADFSPADIALERQPNGVPTYGCLRDPIDPQIVDCIEAPFVLSNSTVRIGNFAGTIRVVRDPSVATKRRLYMAVRGDPSITYGDLDLADLVPLDPATVGYGRLPGGGLYRPGDRYRPGLFDCFDDPSALLRRSEYDAATNATTVPPRCDSSHLIQTYTCNNRIGCNTGDNDIPSEPFNILVDHGTRDDGTPFSRLVVGHLAAGQVSIIDLLGSPYVADVSPPFFSANRTSQRGAFGLARLGVGDTAIYYLTSNLTPDIATFQISGSPTGDTVAPGPEFAYGGAFPSGADARAIIMAPDGKRAFIAQNAPPQLAVLDTRLDQPETHGLPWNKVVSATDICTEPSNMVLRQATVKSATGESVVQTKLYISCFTANQIMIVDPDTQLVEDSIIVGRAPNEIALNYSGIETPAAEALPTPKHRYGYVVLYNESTIGVIDLDPGSPTENRMVARIGMTQPPPSYLTNR